eukprot:TRINITY_DN48465_c0_g1_i1.p1 TRINITY_DN48465_c0_g1~~TRINITY_DN48465_c0_g1_i1.p1  ORF type:complete len:383 (+),score=68.35 TRINITY_DN48465_c0_g1_i1:33-1181(+)
MASDKITSGMVRSAAMMSCDTLVASEASLPVLAESARAEELRSPLMRRSSSVPREEVHRRSFGSVSQGPLSPALVSNVSTDLRDARWEVLHSMILDERKQRTSDVASLCKDIARLSSAAVPPQSFPKLDEHPGFKLPDSFRQLRDECQALLCESEARLQQQMDKRLQTMEASLRTLEKLKDDAKDMGNSRNASQVRACSYDIAPMPQNWMSSLSTNWASTALRPPDYKEATPESSLRHAASSKRAVSPLARQLQYHRADSSRRAVSPGTKSPHQSLRVNAVAAHLCSLSPGQAQEDKGKQHIATQRVGASLPYEVHPGLLAVPKSQMPSTPAAPPRTAEPPSSPSLVTRLAMLSPMTGHAAEGRRIVRLASVPTQVCHSARQ